MERRRRAAPSVVPGLARRQEGDRGRARGAASRVGRRQPTATATSRQDDARCQAPPAKAAATRPQATTVAGIAISHPDKLYFPEAGITKIEVAAILRAHGVVDPAAHRGSPAVARPLSRRLEAAVLLSEARRQERECRGRPHRGAGRRRDRDVHGREQRHGARGARPVGRARIASVGIAHAAPRPSRSADLRLRSRRRRRLEGPRHRRRIVAHAAGRARPRRLSQDDRRQGTARRRSDSRDARLGAGEGLHPCRRRFHGANVRRSLHGDRVEGRAQGQDPHRLSAQRRGRDGHRAVRRACARQRAGLDADRVGGARDTTCASTTSTCATRRIASRSRNAIRGATSRRRSRRSPRRTASA